MKKIAKYFGLLFQISDDFEDYKQDINRRGSKALINYVVSEGYDKSFDDYNYYLKKFVEMSKKENILTKEIIEMTDFLSKKVSVYYKKDYLELIKNTKI